MRRRWAECFEQVLNVEYVKEANLNVVGDRRMPVLGELNESAVLIEEGGSEPNEIWEGTIGLDGFLVECLHKGSIYDSAIMVSETVERTF